MIYQALLPVRRKSTRQSRYMFSMTIQSHGGGAPLTRGEYG